SSAIGGHGGERGQRDQCEHRVDTERRPPRPAAAAQEQPRGEGRKNRAPDDTHRRPEPELQGVECGLSLFNRDTGKAFAVTRPQQEHHHPCTGELKPPVCVRDLSVRRFRIMPAKYPQEVKDRTVRLVLDRRDDYPTEWAAITAI